MSSKILHDVNKTREMFGAWYTTQFDVGATPRFVKALN